VWVSAWPSSQFSVQPSKFECETQRQGAAWIERSIPGCNSCIPLLGMASYETHSCSTYLYNGPKLHAPKPDSEKCSAIFLILRLRPSQKTIVLPSLMSVWSVNHAITSIDSLCRIRRGAWAIPHARVHRAPITPDQALEGREHNKQFFVSFVEVLCATKPLAKGAAEQLPDFVLYIHESTTIRVFHRYQPCWTVDSLECIDSPPLRFCVSIRGCSIHPIQVGVVLKQTVWCASPLISKSTRFTASLRLNRRGT